MLEKARILLGIAEDEADKLSVLETVIKSLAHKVQDYCNRRDMPEGLQDIIVDMAVARWKAEGYGSEEIPQVVSSVSDNGQSVGYKTIGSAADIKSTAFSAAERNLLSAYRKLRW